MVIALSAQACEHSKALGNAQQDLTNQRRTVGERRESDLESRYDLGARLVRERDAVQALMARIEQLGAKPLPCSAVERISRCAPNDDPCQQQVKLLYDISVWPDDALIREREAQAPRPSSPAATVGKLSSSTSQVPFFKSAADAAAFATALDMYGDKQDIAKLLRRTAVPVPSGTSCEVTASAGTLAQVTILTGSLRRETGRVLRTAIRVEAWSASR